MQSAWLCHENPKNTTDFRLEFLYFPLQPTQRRSVYAASSSRVTWHRRDRRHTAEGSANVSANVSIIAEMVLFHFLTSPNLQEGHCYSSSLPSHRVPCRDKPIAVVGKIVFPQLRKLW